MEDEYTSSCFFMGSDLKHTGTIFLMRVPLLGQEHHQWGGFQNFPWYRLCGREGQDDSRKGPLIWESVPPEASNVGLNFVFNQCVLSNYKSSRMPTEFSHLKEKLEQF